VSTRAQLPVVRAGLPPIGYPPRPLFRAVQAQDVCDVPGCVQVGLQGACLLLRGVQAQDLRDVNQDVPLSTVRSGILHDSVSHGDMPNVRARVFARQGRARVLHAALPKEPGTQAVNIKSAVYAGASDEHIVLFLLPVVSECHKSIHKTSVT
jgi:hypothetical protein